MTKISITTKAYCCYGMYAEVGHSHDCQASLGTKTLDGARWKVGDELLPFHPSASHVPPDYRDGWNACYRAFLAAAATPGTTP